MRAEDGSSVWAFDNEPVHEAVAEHLALEAERLRIVKRQRDLGAEIKAHRLTINETHVAPLVAESLRGALDRYRVTLEREGMAWQGRIEVGVVTLDARDLHDRHQAKGTPWCWIGGIKQIEWSQDRVTYRSPEITPERVFAHCERLGMDVTGWGSAMGMDVGVSLVVHRLVEAGAGKAKTL